MIVWFITIKRANYIIPVAPGGGAFAVDGEAVGFGVADEIKPVAAPALAVAGIGEEFVDLLFVGLRVGVGEEEFCFFGGRRDADQIEIDAAKERTAIGFRGRRQVLFFELGEDECVDWVAVPG